MSKHTLDIDCKCQACYGTGLYVGVCERDGAAVVCSKCGGTGKGHIHIEWEDFDKREARADVRRVFRSSCGYVIGSNPETALTLEDFGGMAYEDWKSGAPFPAGSEMRRFVCPAYWAQNIVGKQLAGSRDGGWCLSDIGFCFSKCERFEQKEECWRKWDAERAAEAGGAS